MCILLSALEQESGKLAFILSLPKQGPPLSCMMKPLGLHLRSGFVALLDFRWSARVIGTLNSCFGESSGTFSFFLGCFLLLYFFHLSLLLLPLILLLAVGFFLLWGNHFPIVILMKIGVSPHYISIWAIDGYQPPLYLF